MSTFLLVLNELGIENDPRPAKKKKVNDIDIFAVFNLDREQVKLKLNKKNVLFLSSRLEDILKLFESRGVKVLPSALEDALKAAFPTNSPGSKCPFKRFRESLTVSSLFSQGVFIDLDFSGIKKRIVKKVSFV